MNVWLVRAALRTRGLSPGAFRVLLVHANACPPSGRTCLPGLEEVAEACELSPQHVLRLRAQLVAAGHLRKLAAAHPGQRPVYEVLPAVPIPVRGADRTTESHRVAASGRTDAGNGSHRCDPPYKTQGIIPPTPQPRPAPTGGAVFAGGRGILNQPKPGRSGPRDEAAESLEPQADGPRRRGCCRTAGRPAGSSRRARAAPAGARCRAAGGGVDAVRRKPAHRRGATGPAENVAAVLCAVLRRYALEPSPRELRAAERAAYERKATQPPPEPCAHGDPSGCTACSFCRRGLADPEGERCGRCVPAAPSVPSVPIPREVSA